MAAGVPLEIATSSSGDNPLAITLIPLASAWEAGAEVVALGGSLLGISDAETEFVAGPFFIFAVAGESSSPTLKVLLFPSRKSEP